MKNECFYLICLIGLLSSCNFDNFQDLEPVNVDAEFAVPLFDSRISIADVMDGASENVSVRIEDDNSVTILLNGDVIQKVASEIVPALLGLGDVILPDTVSQIPFVFNDFIIRKAKLKGDRVYFKYLSQYEEDINVTMRIPNLTKDGNEFVHNFTIEYDGNSPIEVTTEDISLEGYLLESDNNSLEHIYDARTASGERVVLELAWSNMNFLVFEYLEGFFGKSIFDIEGDIITIGVYDLWVGGTLSFDDPKVTVRVDNSFGFPVVSQVNELSMTTINDELLNIEADDIEAGVNFEYPSLDEIGQIKSTSFTFNKDNSNIREIFNEKAAKFTYDIDALANPDNDPSIIGFLTDSSYFLINVAIELPMKGSANKFQIQQISADSIDFPADLKEAEFKLIVQNRFPVDMTLQVDFMDDSNTVLDSLFSEALFLRAADLNLDGTVNPLPEESFFYTFDRERVDNIRSFSNIRLRATMTSLNGGQESVTIYDNHTINARMGVKFKIEN